MATRQISYGTYSALTVTSLQSLASSATAGWQSARISNLTDKAIDYEILMYLPTANTAPANDKCIYPFISKAVTSNGGTTWYHADQGTTTVPSGTESATTIVSGGGNMSQAPALAYTTQQQIIVGSFLLSSVVGNNMPDGFSIILINYTGAALSTGCIVAVRPITETII
jgi:hypothetical protein